MIEKGYNKFRMKSFAVKAWLCRNEHTLQTAHTIPGQIDFGASVPAVSAVSSRVFSLLRARLGRNSPIATTIAEEIRLAFADLLVLGDDWSAVNPAKFAVPIVARAGNRAIVGLRLSRNEGYLRLLIKHAVGMIFVAEALSRMPFFLRPLVARLVWNGEKIVKKVGAYLDPVISEYRTRQPAGIEGGEKSLLEALLDNPRTDPRGVTIAPALMILNFAAIHTTSMHFVHCLFALAAHPEYVAPLREELFGVFGQDGSGAVSVAALDKLVFLDSFLKEVQRLTAITITGIARVMTKSVTLPSGMELHANTVVAGPLGAIMKDPEYYPPNPENGDSFDGFRFHRLRCAARSEGKSTEADEELMFTGVSARFFSFALGRHACPGRFFAAMELKIMLAHVLMNYDLKLKEAEAPAMWHMWYAQISRPFAKLMMRRRNTEE
ncbi:cytochrome P450 [Geopyxis carbonaria]|nr:cytochrome P450 [Geopyxis carbonaria]